MKAEDRSDRNPDPGFAGMETDEPMPRLLFDPESVPTVGVSSGPAIPASRLTEATLRDAFVALRPWQPEVSDEARTPRLRKGATGPVPASVLMPIVVRETGLTMLLTERTAHLTDHAGQVSFPGGGAEPVDGDAIATALRETEEEIGLARAHVEVLGRLPDYLTITGFVVAPVVALVHPPFDLTLYDYEVAEAFEVPLAFLMDPANQRIHEVPMPQGARRFLSMPHDGHFTWGATAWMLRNLYVFLRAQLLD